MGAADIINPNAGISAVTGKSAYIGPNPDVVTHLYGIAALAQSAASVYMFWFNMSDNLVDSEYRTFLTSFVVM